MTRNNFVCTILLMFACFFSALAVVYSQHQNRQLFVALQNYYKDFDRLSMHNGLLQLEQSTWASYGRIESKAATELYMRAPNIDDLHFIVLNKERQE